MKTWIRQNWKLKLIALALALLSWISINGFINDQRVITDVPVEIRVRADRVIETADVSTVNVTLRGTRDDVRRLSRLDVSAVVDLTDDDRIGELRLPLTTRAIRFPSHVQLADVSPQLVNVRMDELSQREVRVKDTITGEPMQGFRVDRAFVSPPRIRVRGPKTYVDGLTVINTQSLDVTGRRSSYRERVEIETPPGRAITVEPRWVDVDVRIVEAPVTNTPPSAVISPP